MERAVNASFRPLPPEDLDAVLRRAEGDIRTLGGGDLLLTGGTGFLGTWVMESYLHAQSRLGLPGRLHVLTRDASGFEHKFPHLAGHRALCMVQGDQGDFGFPKGTFSAIIHAAVTYGAPEDLRGRNMAGLARVLEFARRSQVPRTLLLSSGAVYGRLVPGQGPVPESFPGRADPSDPEQAYGSMKLDAEAMGTAHARETGTSFLICRGFSFIGPNLPTAPTGLLSDLMARVRKREPLELRGDGSSWRSFMYTSDFCVWLWAILARGRSARPYNVGSSDARQVAEVARLFRDRLSPGTPLLFRGEPDPNPSRAWYIPSVDRAKRELGLALEVTLEEAIDRTGQWACMERT